ncbi:MAG: HNH endonuclease family protein [Acidimicrobiales bacterium]
MEATRGVLERSVVRLFALLGALFVVVAVAAPSATGAPPDEVAGFLSVLHVESEGSMDGYDRDLFPHWIDNNGDCQDTRDEVLAWESFEWVDYDDAGCNVVWGEWWSAYDDVWLTDPADIHIDHVIALAEAWRSGARFWSTDQRRAFANDLSREETLRAVSGSANASKSDRDPSEWLPPNGAFVCHHLIEWVVVKEAWDLSVDGAEYDALYDGLLACDLPG